MTAYAVASIQTHPIFGEVSANLERQRVLVLDAVGRGARLVVLPECSTTGWCFDSESEASELAEPLEGPDAITVQTWTRWAQELDIHLVAGIVERAEGAIYNTAVIVDGSGVVGTYRKLHTWGPERDVFGEGDKGVPVFDTPLGRLAMAICYDVWFPEVARLAAVQGADVLCVPSNWIPVPTQTDDVPAMATMLCMTQAHTNLLYVAAASRVGVERGQPFIGSSVIVDHSGFPLAGPASGVDEEVLMATIDPIGSRHDRLNNPFNQPLGDRRADVYATP